MGLRVHNGDEWQAGACGWWNAQCFRWHETKIAKTQASFYINWNCTLIKWNLKISPPFAFNRTEIEELQSKVNRERDKYEKSAQGDSSGLSAIPFFAVNDKVSPSPDACVVDPCLNLIVSFCTKMIDGSKSWGRLILAHNWSGVSHWHYLNSEVNITIKLYRRTRRCKRVNNQILWRLVFNCFQWRAYRPFGCGKELRSGQF